MNILYIYIFVLLLILYIVVTKYDVYENFTSDLINTENLENLKSFLREYKDVMIDTNAYTIEEYESLMRIVSASTEGETMTSLQEDHIRELIKYMNFTTSKQGRNTINKYIIKKKVIKKSNLNKDRKKARRRTNQGIR